MSCNCKLCQRHVEFEKHIKTMNPEAQDFFTRIYEDLDGAETDINVHQAMLAGDWPGGRLVFIPNCEAPKEIEKIGDGKVGEKAVELAAKRMTEAKKLLSDVYQDGVWAGRLLEQSNE